MEGNCPGTPGPGGYPPGPGGYPPGAAGAPGNWPGAPGPGGKEPGADGPLWGKPEGAVGWPGPPEDGKLGPPGAAPGHPGLVGGGAPFPGADGLVCLVFDASPETSSGIASASYRKKMQEISQQMKHQLNFIKNTFELFLSVQSQRLARANSGVKKRLRPN